MVVEKRGGRWCVVHGHPQKKGSKTDKPKGSVIKCFESKEKAMAMHRAILISQAKQKRGDTKGEECVQRWIKKLTKDNPEMEREQVIAAAFSKCRAKGFKLPKPKGDSVELDALFRDQVVTKAGVLMYTINGKTVHMAKKWDDLKLNIGRVLPITIEHPNPDNGNKGMHNEEIIAGYIGPLRQYKNKHILIGDKYIDDDVDPLNGQSVGFSYIPIAEDGELNGDLYDEIQSDLWLDHLALTSNPREPFALHTEDPEVVLQLAAAAAGSDSQDSSKTTLRTKYWMGYDNVESLEIKSNQQIEKYPKVDSNMSTELKNSEENAKLREELATLKAEKASADSFKEELDKKEKEVLKLKEERDDANEQLKTHRNKDVAVMVDSIKSVHGFPEDFIESKVKDLTDTQKEFYIRGASDALNTARELWSTGSDAEKGTPAPPKKKTKDGKPKIQRFASYEIDNYDFETGKMKDPLGNPPGTDYDENWKPINK